MLWSLTSSRHDGLTYSGQEGVPLVEFMYLVFTRMQARVTVDDSGILLLCLCDVFRALMNSFMCQVSFVCSIWGVGGMGGGGGGGIYCL